MMNIVIPMAGRGSRFADVGYTTPKPLIPVKGVPMIQVVVNNLRPRGDAHFVFLCLQEHLDRYGVDEDLKKLVPGCSVLTLNQVSEGPACTVLVARDLINNDEPLMIANSDQWVDIDINDYLADMEARDLDGLIMTMKANHPKWSYVRLDENDRITEVVEKVVVSDEATVGIYNYRRGSQFVAAADRMIAKNLRVNNEFYVAPAYNEMIADGAKIGYYNIGSEYDGMYGLGTPEDLDKFLGFDVSTKAVTFQHS